MFAGWRDVTPPHACGYGGFESVAGGSSAAAHGARTRAQSEFAPPDRNELVHQLGGAPPPAAQVVPTAPTLHGEWDVGRARDGSPALPPRPALGSAGAEVALGRVVRPYCS